MPESDDQSLQNLLNSYNLGHKLRRLRLRKKIALVDLGKHTGLSASMLSQLETGKMVPTLPTLARIAMVFDVGLEHFFDFRSREKLFSIVHADERLKFPDNPESPLPSYYFECLAFATRGKDLGAYLAEFPKRNVEEVPEHRHEGSEFIFIVAGSVAVRYQEKDYVLRNGDSVYFDSSELHSYRGLGRHGGTAVVLTLPPRI
jgi:transcriptional regulator with XRE-family HTH domain